MDDRDANVLAFVRFSAQGVPLVMVANLSPVPRPAYRVPMPFAGRWREILNSDSDLYGGANLGNMGGGWPGTSPGARSRPRPRWCCPRWASCGWCPSREGRALAGILTPAWERPLGAIPGPRGRTTFRVWAPSAGRVAALVNGAALRLEPVGEGVFEGEGEAVAGDDYHLVVDGGVSLPDPCSRSQPEGVLGPSRVVDPGAFAWSDAAWGGLDLRELVLYELHVGTFTRAGTFDARDRAPGRAARAGRHRDRADAGRHLPGRRATGATTACTRGRRTRLRRPRGPRGA